jgi:hypothetical protein
MVVFAAAPCCERRRSRVSGGRLLRTDTATGHGESPQGTAEVLAAEYLFRQFWFRDYGIGPVSRALSRWLPAENTVRGRRSLAWRNSHCYRLAQCER